MRFSEIPVEQQSEVQIARPSTSDHCHHPSGTGGALWALALHTRPRACHRATLGKRTPSQDLLYTFMELSNTIHSQVLKCVLL